MNAKKKKRPHFNKRFPKPSKVVQRDRVAFVQSCWHKDIVDQLRDSFTERFSSLSDKEIDYFEVPGAYEIPLHAKYLAQSKQYAGIIAAGLVVDGGVYQHEFVAKAVIDGLMQAQMRTGTPIFSAVLTPHDFISEGQPEFFKEHFVTKGIEAADACAETLLAMTKIPDQHC